VRWHRDSVSDSCKKKPRFGRGLESRGSTLTGSLCQFGAAILWLRKTRTPLERITAQGRGLGRRGSCGRVPFGLTWIAAAPLGRTTARGRVRPLSQTVNRSCPTPPRTRLTTLQCLLGQTSDRVREIVVSARPATFSTCHIGKMELSHEASQVCSANAQSQRPSSVGIPRGREPRPGLFYVYGTVAHTTRTGKD
jgi:hypothetical protein